jgi:hypothetical protein
MLTARNELRHTLNCVKDTITSRDLEVLTRLVNRISKDEAAALATLLAVVEQNAAV